MPPYYHRSARLQRGVEGSHRESEVGAFRVRVSVAEHRTPAQAGRRLAPSVVVVVRHHATGPEFHRNSGEQL
eukprot:scaffold71440_cov57-Phaeocystis_antarctica.AAC.1